MTRQSKPIQHEGDIGFSVFGDALSDGTHDTAVLLSEEIPWLQIDTRIEAVELMGLPQDGGK
jgi:hypothetical protein